MLKSCENLSVHVELKSHLKVDFQRGQRRGKMQTPSALPPIMDFNVFLYFDEKLRASLKGIRKNRR